jgi:hypothetical protein
MKTIKQTLKLAHMVVLFADLTLIKVSEQLTFTMLKQGIHI